MNIRNDIPNRHYRFYSPNNTNEILFDIIQKKGRWEFNRRKNREEKKEWWYESLGDFEKNFALLFGKFIPYTLIRKEDGENKEKYLRFIINEFEKIKKGDLLTSFEERNSQIYKNLENSGYKIEYIKAVCRWRLIIGLGASHPQETSMTLHHIYGIPYIPGSAIKGITRHFGVLKFAEKDKRDDEKFEDAVVRIAKYFEEEEGENIEVNGTQLSDLIEIFGNQKRAGKVIFMDAYPVGNITFKIDIMNPHYPEYYSGIAPPADWQNPNPIKFLTIEKTIFLFVILSKDEEILKKARKLLEESLKEYGIGAKTSLGYGIFIEIKQK